MKIALGIEYKGTGFNGWQIQPSCPSVQKTIEEALEAFLCVPTPTFCAGRTDTGVHAMQQVVSIDTEADRPERNWVRGLNAFLPEGVAVRWARRVPDDFNARFSARSRSYEYWIYNDPIRSPVLSDLTGWVFRPLDVDKMREGAQHLLGEHDFTSFRAAECQAATPVRTIHRLELTRMGRLVGVRIEANAFLQHMVRNIVGSLIFVGTGRERPEWIGEVLRAKSRAVAAPTFSPNGLYLMGVNYEDPNLPASGPSPFGWVDAKFEPIG